MPAKKRKQPLTVEIPALSRLTRRDLSNLLSRISKDPQLLETASSTSYSLHESYIALYRLIACSESFPYAEKEGAWLLEFADPGLLVQQVLSQSQALARRFVAALQKGLGTREAPLHTIVGFDEFQPGNKFDFDKAKAVMCVYFNFKEIDTAATGCTWFCCMAARSNQIDAVAGGWSCVLARLLLRMFSGPHGFQATGIAFVHENKEYLVYAGLANLLSDGDGIRKGYGWRGASSLKASPVHSNILKKGSDLATRAPGFVETDCADPSRLKLATAAEFHASCDLIAEAHARLSRGDLTQKMFKTICMAESMNFIPNGLGFDQRLRQQRIPFFESLTMDWVHTFLQDGIFSVEAKLLLQSVSSATPELLRAFLRLNWQFPCHLKAKGKLLWRVFDEHRLDERGEVDKIRASASELLALYSLLRHFVATQVAIHAEHSAAWQSFTACCTLLDLILAAKNGMLSPRATAPMLRQQIASFMQKHISAHGSSYVRPKHCWAWAIPEHWTRDDFVFDAFIVERMHLVVKQTAAPVRYTPRLEQTTLAGVLNAQLASLQSFHGNCCFLDASPVSLSEFPSALFADSMQVNSMQLHVNDMVFVEDTAAELIMCALEGNRFYGVVVLLEKERQLTKHAAIWKKENSNLQIVPAETIMQACEKCSHSRNIEMIHMQTQMFVHTMHAA